VLKQILPGIVYPWQGIWETAGLELHGPNWDLCMAIIFTNTVLWHWATAP